MLGRDLPEDTEDLDDLPSGEAEEIESEVADAATAARTVAELDKEISLLEELARRVRHSGTDRKWTELRDLLSDNELIKDADGNVRKIIVFTEHQDTLEYLAERIRGLLGRPEAVVITLGVVAARAKETSKEQSTRESVLSTASASGYRRSSWPVATSPGCS